MSIEIALELYSRFLQVFGEPGDFSHDNKDIIRSLSRANGEDDFLKTIIILVVGKYFKIARNEIMQQRTSGIRTDAVATCCFLYKKHLNLSHAKIAKLLMYKSRSLITKYLKFMEGLDDRLPQDRNIKSKLILIEEEIKQHKINYQKNNQ